MWKRVCKKWGWVKWYCCTIKRRQSYLTQTSHALQELRVPIEWKTLCLVNRWLQKQSEVASILGHNISVLRLNLVSANVYGKNQNDIIPLEVPQVTYRKTRYLDYANNWTAEYVDQIQERKVVEAGMVVVIKEKISINLTELRGKRKATSPAFRLGSRLLPSLLSGEPFWMNLYSLIQLPALS